ncbi:AraC family transcriptional regulator [Synoicihabitans lomoniglobus]
MKPHEHTGFEFMYLSRGQARWRAGGQTLVQQPGELYLAYPRERHGTGAKRNTENQQLWVGLDLDAFGADGRRLAARLRRDHPRILRGCDNIEPVLRAVVRQVVTKQPRRTAAIRSLLRTFLVLVEQKLDTVDAGAANAEEPVLPHSYGVRQALAFLARNLQRRVPLRDLAAVATVRSVPHFCAQFQREVGVSPAAYHLQARLEAARLALRQPAFDVTNTAQHFGFSSSQHFGTQFRRAFGVTPGQWRRGADRGCCRNSTAQETD